MFFLPVMLLLLSGCSAEVVDDFQRACGQFFANGIPPTVFTEPQYIQICQTLNGNRYFATLYDTDNRIPVYSAYKFMGRLNCRGYDRRYWYTEPQLEFQNLPRFIFQASNEDYSGSGYNKGHLAPVSLANSQGCAYATFTLTNAAPQNPSFNSGEWRMVERDMKETLSNYCKDKTAYIVTGVVPGNIKINNRVNVPSYFWTAYCCQSNNNQIISGGVLGENAKKPILNMDVRALDFELKEFYGAEFFLFDDICRFARYVPVNSIRLLRIISKNPKY